MIYLILFLVSTAATQNFQLHSSDDRTITGAVVDATNEPLPFCNILAYDKHNKMLTGTVTDIKGDFKITVSGSCHWIEAAYTGMQTTRIEVGEANDYVISMKAGIELSEVVVIAYDVPLVEYNNTTSEGVERIRNLPTKNINAIAATTAGLSSTDGDDVLIRGTRADATDYYVDGIRVSKSSADGSGPTKSLAETSDESLPAISVTSTSSTPKPSEIVNNYAAGQLTAGEINDFGKWVLWNDKSQQELTEYRKTWNIYPLNRYMVIVQNTAGIPVINQTVKLLDNKKNIVWTAKTDNTGKAELWSNMFAETYKDGQNFSISTKVNDREVSISNAKRFDKGVNHMTIKSDCNLSNVVDAVFVVDATGSMSDELQYLQEELMDVMRKVKDKNQDLTINLGCVFYRDHGDEYVTRTSGLSSDLSKTIGFIQNQTANGGGDTPEALDEALEVAIGNMNWSSDARTKLLFVVTDAPPHQGVENLDRLSYITFDAAMEGIRIIPLTASGIDKSSEYLLRSLALCTNGTYVFLTDHSGIGNPHLQPTTDKYDVEKLNDLIVRLFDQYTSAVSCSKNSKKYIQVMSDTLEIQSQPLFVTDTLPGIKTAEMENETKRITCKYYPNPTSGLLNIDVEGKIEELFLCDGSGKLLERFEVNGEDKLQVVISQYPVGTYRLMYFEKINVPRSGMVVLAK